MANLPPSREEQVARVLRSGGRVVAISGPRRTGLTWYVNSKLPNWLSDTGSGRSKHVFDVKEFRTAETMLQGIAIKLRLKNIPTNCRELSNCFLELSSTSGSTIVFLNFHRGTPELQDLLLSTCLDSGLPHGTSLFPNFILEGAVNFEEMSAKNQKHAQPFTVYTETQKPWQTIVDVEQLISNLSPTHYPLSLVAWVSDVTNGDTGFCSEFLLRLATPAPTSDVLNAAYHAVIKNGSTARELRDASKHLNQQLISRFLSGYVVPGLPPPDGPPDLTELYLSGIAKFNELVGGYCLRSRIVSDSLRLDGNWEPQLGPLPHGTACLNHILWQAADVEVLLRSLVRIDPKNVEALEHITVPTPWNGKAKEISRRISKLLEESISRGDAKEIIMENLSVILGECLPDQIKATIGAKYALGRVKNSEGFSLVDGLTFFDLANLALRLGIVSAEEREKLDSINARRNDSAHFRPVAYDDAYRLETIVSDLLRSINGRANHNTNQ